jgi:SAM-dependent methyltransferase
MNKKELIRSAYKESISITHRHVLAIINTMLKYEKILQGKPTIKILDAGCGDGRMLFFLHKYLPLFNPDIQFLVYGYDLLDHGVQEKSYVKRTFSYLYENSPGIAWDERIKMINSSDNWPFDNQTFDFVVSNQVLEHVWDHDQFFREQSRVLQPKGFSLHIFPVKEVIMDGHIFLPNVHKLNSWDAIYKKIKFYSKVGLGIVYQKEKKDYNNNLDHFSRVWADKIYHYCNYPTYKELSKSAKKNHLCITTRFTFDFYRRKIKEILGIEDDLIYKNKASSKITFFFLKRISGVSIVIYKGEYSTY